MEVIGKLGKVLGLVGILWESQTGAMAGILTHMIVLRRERIGAREFRGEWWDITRDSHVSRIDPLIPF
jgi:hypothetical protein